MRLTTRWVTYSNSNPYLTLFVTNMWLGIDLKENKSRVRDRALTYILRVCSVSLKVEYYLHESGL